MSAYRGSYRQVAIPLVSGEDSTSDARGVDAPANVIVENASFVDRTGIRKRHGHIRADIDTSDTPGTYYARTSTDDSTVSDGVMTPPDDFVYGRGYVPNGYLPSETFPDMAAGMSVFTRGDQLLAARPGQIRAYTGEENQATVWDFPVCTAETTARASRSTKQTHADSCTTDGVTLHAWIDYATGSAAAMYSIFRSDGTPFLVNQSFGTTSPTYVRTLATDNYLYAAIFYNGSNTTTVFRWAVAAVSTPLEYTVSNTRRFFDWCVYKDDIIIIYGNTNANEFSTDIRKQNDFNERSARAPLSAVAFSGSSTAGDIVQTATVSTWASQYDSADDFLMIAWSKTDSGAATSQLGFKSYLISDYNSLVSTVNLNGSLAAASLGTDFRNKHLTVTANEMGTEAGVVTGHLFCDIYDASPGSNDPKYRVQYYTGTVSPTGTDILSDTPTQEYAKQLASKCWVVGQKPFVVTLHNIDDGTASGAVTPNNRTPQYQRSYLVMDENLQPVGQLCYGTAYADQFNASSLAAGDKWLPTVDRGSSGYSQNEYRKYLSLQYVEKLTDLLSTYSAATEYVFAEPSVREYVLDFSPQLTVANYGKSSYFPGAMPWAFDGTATGEGAFLQFPEYTVYKQNSTGLLTNSGTYSYLVYAYRKTGQGDVMLSGALPVTTTLGASDNTVTLRIRRVPTRYTDVFFKVYRTTNGGSTYYLVSNPDPSSASCPANPAVGTGYVDFVDLLPDDTGGVTIAYNELAPGTGGVLDNLCPPASSYVAVAGDRLFLWGGEVSDGEVVFSKSSDNYSTPGFNPVLSHVIDRSGDQLTGMTTHADMIVCVTENTVYAIDNVGPDNLGAGEFQPPRILNQAHGCISPFSLAVTPIGVVYCSKRGIHILGQTPTHFGWPVTARLTGADFIGTLSVQADHQVRFYLSNGNCLVFDYDLKRWSTWTGLGANSVCSYRGRAALLTANGDMLIEDTDTYTDAGSTYRLRVRTGWLQPKVEGRMMVRRVRLVGTVLDPSAEVRLSVYTDDMGYPQTQVDWKPTSDDTQATTGWGAGTWGDGAWGAGGSADTYLDREVARISCQLNYPRCSRVSTDVRIDDDSAGLILTHVVYEVAADGGLAITPLKTFI